MPCLHQTLILFFIRGIPMRDVGQEAFPEEWPYWLRDAAGNRVPDERWKSFLIDFTLPNAQEWIIQHALAALKMWVIRWNFH